MPPASDQLVVVTVLHEPAVLEHQHSIGARRGRQAVGDGDRRAPLGEVGQRARDAHLGRGRRRTTSPRRARARRDRRRRPAAGRRAGAPPPTAARRARRPRVIRPSGSASTQSPTSRRATTPPCPAIDVPGRAKPTLAAIVSSNRNGSWETTTRRWRSSSLATSWSGTPPRRIWPIVGSAKRAIRRPSVVLPEPVAPTIATCWPAGMCTLTWRSTAASTSAVTPRVG